MNDTIPNFNFEHEGSTMKSLGFTLFTLCLFQASSAIAQNKGPVSVTAAAPAESTSEASQAKQYIEVRTYQLKDAAAEAKLDEYLQTALIPALERQGLGPIGALDQFGESEAVEVKLIIPGPSAEAVLLANQKLADDAEYQAAAKGYLETPRKQAPIIRIRSELLLAFDCWPKVTVPSQKKDGKDRFFELRTYESSTERLGNLKVEMFNEGEVPIFLDAGIMPVFMGQALVGEMMPNLTYMVCFDDEEAMKAAWPNFVKHPDWKTLSSVEKYKGTVSKNNKSYWTPKSYSQL